MLGTTDFRYVRALREQRDDILGLIEGGFDHVGPDRSTGDALLVEPGVEALFLKVTFQTLGERGSVFAGIGEEDVGGFRRWHDGDRPL